jgi:undecaprenyl-phosphate 4-deoxy-4-formamido-L-arabinose transferase
VRERITDIRLTDQGCMLRAYRRPVIEAIVRSGERATFIPALAYKFASKNAEVEVAHAARTQGESKYSYYKLIRLNFDLITGFSLVPLQVFTLFSMACSGGSLFLVAVILFRRFVLNLDRETFGVFTLLAIVLFLISVCMVGIGLIGEYVGRTYQCVQQRPRYVVREVLEKLD